VYPVTSIDQPLPSFSLRSQASEELEDRESLAVMAASGLHEAKATDEHAEEEDANCRAVFMEQYTRGIAGVETILSLDRLRQSVAVREAEASAAAAAASAVPSRRSEAADNFMRKTVSVPNFGHVSLLLLLLLLLLFSCRGGFGERDGLSHARAQVFPPLSAARD